MSEQSLAIAVLAMAYDDYCAGEPVRGKSPGTYAERLREYREAKAFCTATHGAWARSRRDWCALAGVDPDAFRDKCVKSREAAA